MLPPFGGGPSGSLSVDADPAPRASLRHRDRFDKLINRLETRPEAHQRGSLMVAEATLPFGSETLECVLPPKSPVQEILQAHGLVEPSSPNAALSLFRGEVETEAND